VQYPEFQKNKYGNSYRFLEVIENKEYWQIGEFVHSCLPDTQPDEEDGYPPVNVTEEVCSFPNWETTKQYILKRASQLPFTEYKFPCVCRASKDANKSVIHHFKFYSVAEILDDEEIKGLYVRADAFGDGDKYCDIYAEHGTGYAYARGSVRKLGLNNLSRENIERFIRISQVSTPEGVQQSLLNFWVSNTTAYGSYTEVSYTAEAAFWLKQLGYDISAITEARAAYILHHEQERAEAQAKKEAEELAKKEQEVQQRSQSLITVRNLLFGDKSCIFSNIPFGHESLIALIEEHVGKVPLRTKGWIYNNLHSMTGERYRYTGGDSKTFNKLIYSLQDILKENK
jgi:hypothetical protein